MKQADNNKFGTRNYLYPLTTAVCIAVITGIIPYFTTDCIGKKLTIPYESPEMLIASDVLPEDLQFGENYQVRGKTASTADTKTDGFTHSFNIITPFGKFEAHSQAMVRKLIHEIKAISILREIKKTKSFSVALEKAGKSSYRGAKNLIWLAPDTVTGLPEGGLRSLSQSGELTKGDGEDQEKELDGILEDFGKLKRHYAYKLGVDPYSTNRGFQRELNSVSWAGLAGEAGVSLVTQPLKGTAGMVIERNYFFDKIEKIVRDNAPDELQRINREKLKEMGTEDSVIETFLNHPQYSPTRKTILVHSLAEMNGVKNRDQFIKQAILVQHEENAYIQQLNAEMMMSYHKNIKPFLELIPVQRSVVGYTADQTIVATYSLDHVYWTELTDLFVSEILELLKSPDYPAKQFILRISGKFSDRARTVLSDKGIILEENIERKI